MDFETYRNYMDAYAKVIKEANETEADSDDASFLDFENTLELDTVYSLRAILESKTGWKINEFILNDASYTLNFICNGATMNYDSRLSLEYIDIMNLQCKVSKNIETELCNIICVDDISSDDKDLIRRISQFIDICNEQPEKLFKNIKKNTSLL